MLNSRRYTVTPFDENGNSSLAAAAVQITTSGLAALTNVTANRSYRIERGRGGVNRAGLLGSCLRSCPGD